MTFTNPAETFLLEPELPGKFEKYLNNSQFIGLGYTSLHKFFCFAQHVIDNRSKGQMIITDFQGNENGLTDPQLATAA